jgi:hypothetical protein
LRGQPYRYSSCKPRGFPSTSAAMTARTNAGPVPKGGLRLGLCAAGPAAGSLRGADTGRAGAGRGCGALGAAAGACARACGA